jgi:GntR family transcriptional regulator, transcriptional repressor for pyruvate dehydrogenase complex
VSVPSPDDHVISLFSSARRLRSSDDVVDQLRDVISRGRLVEGDRLPSERELAQAFAVSRSTLREALRMLEAVGVLRIRAGAGGGIFVSEPGQRELARGLEQVLGYGGATTQEVVEYGVSLISETAYWAAVRATPENIASIRRASEALVEAAAAGAAARSAAGHAHLTLLEEIAQATRNRVRLALVLGIHPSLIGRNAPVVTPALASGATTVVEAIREHKARDARIRMYRHLQLLLAAPEDR